MDLGAKAVGKGEGPCVQPSAPPCGGERAVVQKCRKEAAGESKGLEQLSPERRASARQCPWNTGVLEHVLHAQKTRIQCWILKM